MAKRTTIDWDTVTRFQARSLVAVLRKALPGQWGRHLEILSVNPDHVPVWLRAREWLDRVEQFKKDHGDAVTWAMSDSQICDKATEYAAWVDQLIELKSPDCCDAEKLDKVLSICDLVGVDYPVAVSALGAVNRVLSAVWWRRMLRRKVSRVVEHGAIKLGVVNRRDGGYASDDAVRRRAQQIARNAAMMEATLLKNEAGQVFKLSDLAKKSTANPEIRGGELMVRIRGCEDYAMAAGHVGYFLTATCPSKFHAVLSGGKGPGAYIRPNPKYDGVSSPRDAQMWLRTQWSRVRAEWARDGIAAYGFRVAEPHHDGCPHWHLMLWWHDKDTAVKALAIMGKHWLSDGGGVVPHRTNDEAVIRFTGVKGAGHEPGSLNQRLNVKRLHAGGAAGYCAKYVAKNIGHFDVGMHLDGVEVSPGAVAGWQRVDAWAATWGIRQFQAIGQPSVTVWRELRRVTKDQIESAQRMGDAVVSKLWHAVHKFGEGPGSVAADWCRYLTHQGGVCLGRAAYAMRSCMRVVPEHVNGYGEVITQKTIIGCQVRKSGRVLVSRRQAWIRVCDIDTVEQTPEERAALGAPWTRFNNCTARLGGELRAALFGFKNAASMLKVGALDGWGGVGMREWGAAS